MKHCEKTRSVQKSSTAKKEMGEKCGKSDALSTISQTDVKSVPATKEDPLLADRSESRGPKRSSASTMAARSVASVTAVMCSRRNPTEFSIRVRSTMECVH